MTTLETTLVTTPVTMGAPAIYHIPNRRRSLGVKFFAKILEEKFTLHPVLPDLS